VRKRFLLLALAAVVVVVLLLYPSTQCRVTESELTLSPLRSFVISVQEGYAVGFSFNVTNHAGCKLTAQSTRAVLRGVTYGDGRQVTQNLEEIEGASGTLMPGESGTFSHSFDSYFDYRPVRLLLRVEITFAETGPILVFDGELAVPP